MSSPTRDPVIVSDDRQAARNAMTSFIQISALVLLLGLCALILDPFAGIIVWGVILSVAVYPLHRVISRALGGRGKLSAALITLTGLAILSTMGWLIVDSSVAAAQSVHEQVQQGALRIPPPNDRIKTWPLIGEQVYTGWSTAHDNLEGVLTEHLPKIRGVAEHLLRFTAAAANGLLYLVASIILAGFLLNFAGEGYRTTVAICDRILIGRGTDLANLMVSTVRSVTNGVLGVAAIQAMLAGIGFVAIGLPLAGFLTLAVMVLAIVQLPSMLILVPVIIWVFSFANTGAAVVFAIYTIAVSLSDNVLKPLLLGRGVDLPLVVVLLGAIGGMIKFGVVGLFVGAVILGIGYRVISAWIWSRDFGASGAATPTNTPTNTPARPDDATSA